MKRIDIEDVTTIGTNVYVVNVYGGNPALELRVNKRDEDLVVEKLGFTEMNLGYFNSIGLGKAGENRDIVFEDIVKDAVGNTKPDLVYKEDNEHAVEAMYRYANFGKGYKIPIMRLSSLELVDIVELLQDGDYMFEVID